MLEEAKQLRQVNHDLEQEVDRLRTGHCLDVEELVYLRWVNACLRFEVKNFQMLSGKTAATNLSKTWSPRSQQKVKQLVLEYANSGIDVKTVDLVDFNSGYCSSSQTSVLTGTGEFDDHSISNSSTKRISSSKKQKMWKKLRKIFSVKHDHFGNKRISSVGRTSMSSVASSRTSSSTGSLDDTGGSCSDSISSCISVEHTAANLHMLEAKIFHDSSILAAPRKETQAKNGDRQNRINRCEKTPMPLLDIQRLAT